MMIQGPKACLEELSTHIRGSGIEVSVTQGIGGLDILNVAIGASIPLLGQAIIAYLARYQGARRIVVERSAANGVEKIEVQSPTESELTEMLTNARNLLYWKPPMTTLIAHNHGMNAEPPVARFQVEHQPRRPGYARRYASSPTP